MLLRLFDISRRVDMKIQPQLILLQKTLLNIEGLGRDLYPELHIWQTAPPILRQWMSERVSGATVVRDIRTQLPEVLEALRMMPTLVKGAVQRAQDGTLRLQVEAQNVTALQREIRDGDRRRDAITIGSAILLGGLVWLAVSREPAWPGAALTAVGVAWLAFAWRRRRG